MAKKILSPFVPGRPAPPGAFVGRAVEAERLRRKVAAALAGRLEVGFVAGERGVGKSSLASFVRAGCEKEMPLLGLHMFLGGVSEPEEMVHRTFEQLAGESVGTKWSEQLRGFFGEHIAEVGLFGFTVGFAGSDRDRRRLLRGFPSALRNLLTRLGGEKRGILLILDDIGDLAASEPCACWLKSLVDEISVARRPLPLCLLLVGLEAHRQALVGCHPSLARVLDLVDVEPWTEDESREFFAKAFTMADRPISDEARLLLARCCCGMPFVAHELGKLAFEAAADDQHVDIRDASRAVAGAADLVARKYLRPELRTALRGTMPQAMLAKVVHEPLGPTFVAGQLLRQLTAEEAKAVDSFFGGLVELGMLASAPEHGPDAYAFTSRLHQLYFQLEAERAKRRHE